MKLRSHKTARLKSTTPRVDPEDIWGSLQNTLDRGSPPTYETSFNYQVHGVYSLPEFWSKLQASGSVDQWSYVVKLNGAVLEQGKLNPRELTEEELKEIENKKKPPPKINKKDLDAVRAEEERIARELKEKEDKEKEFQDMLNKMEEKERYYYLKELPTREPWIAWTEKNITAVMKNGDTLIELEEDVNVHKGAILEMNFVPGADDNEKKRPKPKGINPEDVKPIYCVSWIDFNEFHQTPGLTEITLRSKLMLKSTYEQRIDEYEAKTGIKELNPTKEDIWKMMLENKRSEKEGKDEHNENNKQQQDGDANTQQEEVNEQTDPYEELYDYVEKAQTYIYIKIVLSQPINPVLPDIPLPEPIDLIKKEEKKVKKYTVDEIENDLLRQFKIAIAAIAKTYDEAMGDSEKGVLVRREKGNTLSNAKREERDNNINKFLEKFNNSGRANLLKEKLKKFIVKIVREKYKKKYTPVKGVFKDQRDQFYSELYAYLTDKVKRATSEFLHLKNDEIHEHVLTSFSQSKKEIMNFTVRQNKEPEDKRLLRLCKENELLDNFSNAVKYYKSILAIEQNKTAWINYLNLVKKLDDINEVEYALNNAITMDSENGDLNLLIVFCGLLYIKGQIQNAINFMNLILMKNGLNNTSYLFNAFLAFLYKERIPKIENSTTNTNVKAMPSDKVSENNAIPSDNPQPVTINPMSNQNLHKANELLFLKHFEAAKTFKLRSLPPEELKPLPTESSNVHQESNTKKEKEKDKDKNVQQLTEEQKTEMLKKGNPKLNPEYKPPSLTIQQCDSIWFDAIELFNSFSFYEISEKILNYINEETKNDPNFKLIQAKIFLSRKDYDKVIEECDLVLEGNNNSYMAHLLKGHAYYYSKNYTDSETSYIKAIRLKPQEIKFDLQMLTKLSLLYINTQSWYEAKVILQEILRDSVEHSFAWRYLGFVQTKLGEYDEAEAALTQANLLDVENPTIWAYLTIFCLYSKRKNRALECLNELNKVNYSDVPLLKEIALLFLQNEEYVISANLYKKILLFVPDDVECYLQIAKIYYEHNELQRKEAIEVLKEGRDKVRDEDGLKKINELIRIYQNKEDKMITLDNDDIKDDEVISLMDSQVKGDQFFKDEGELGEEEKQKNTFENEFN